MQKGRIGDCACVFPRREAEAGFGENASKEGRRCGRQEKSPPRLMRPKTRETGTRLRKGCILPVSNRGGSIAYKPKFGNPKNTFF